MSFLDHTRRPAGLGGQLMVRVVNLGHRSLTRWGLSQLPDARYREILDCGCGGGAAIRRLLRAYPQSTVQGVDYSAVSVQTARRVNRRAIAAGRCGIETARVTQLPFEAERFDLVTAFETVYFWQDLAGSFSEIFRVLAPGGTLLICNECGGAPGGARWEQVVSGMHVYAPEELHTVLERSGFQTMQVFENKQGWLCVIARKEGKLQ